MSQCRSLEPEDHPFLAVPYFLFRTSKLASISAMSSSKSGTTIYRTSERNKEKHISIMGCGPVCFNINGRLIPIEINFELPRQALPLMQGTNFKQGYITRRSYQNLLFYTVLSKFHPTPIRCTKRLNNRPNTWPYHIVQGAIRRLFTVDALVQYQSVLWELWQVRWPICGITNMGLSLTLLLQLQQDCK